jgi:hypothetical protein
VLEDSVAPIRVSIFFMEVTVKIPDELAAWAKSRGLRIEDYVAELLARQFGAQRADASPLRAPEEIRAWLDLSGPQLNGNCFVSRRYEHSPAHHASIRTFSCASRDAPILSTK